MSYFDIEKKSLIAWYELRVSDKNLVVDVHPKAWKFFLKTLEKYPKILKGYKDLGISGFIAPKKSQTWGFGEAVFWQKSRRESWISVECMLPMFPAEGEAYAPVWERFISISATLKVLFEILLYFEEIIENYYSPQLLIISLMTVKSGQHGGSLSAIFSKDICGFISKEIEIYGQTTMYPPIIKAMHTVFLHVESREPSFGKFQAEIHKPKWFHLLVPGDGCTLDPADYYDEKTTRGYEVRTHNSDKALQQLYFLTGLAALYDHARKWSWLDKCSQEIKSALKEGDLSVGYDMGNHFTFLSQKSNDKPICGVDGEVSLEEIKMRYWKER